jgi:hypothetical protein
MDKVNFHKIKPGFVGKNEGEDDEEDIYQLRDR